MASKNDITISFVFCIPIETITANSRFRSSAIISTVPKTPKAIIIYNIPIIKNPPALSPSICCTTSGDIFCHAIALY